MFNKTDSDLTKTLTRMIEQSIDQTNFNQPAAVELTARWISQDRRFDGLDPRATAREAFDAKQHGRQMRLGPQPYRTDSGAGTRV